MYHLFLGFLVLLLPLRACAGFASHEMEEVGMAMNGARQTTAARLRPECPRCHSGDTKFCYYNNYSLSQPRYHCRGCRRYWTQGGSLRDVPVGGGCRNRNKQQQQQQRSAASSSSSSSAMVNLIPDMLPAFVPPPGWGSDLVLPPPAAAPSSFLDILRSGGGLLPIDAAMPLPAMASFGTGMQQHAMGDTTMVGLEWQPQLTGGINGGAGSSGVAQQHLGNNMTDDINGGQGSSRDDYYWYWIDDDNNGGPWQSLINNNNTSSLM